MMLSGLVKKLASILSGCENVWNSKRNLIQFEERQILSIWKYQQRPRQCFVSQITRQLVGQPNSKRLSGQRNSYQQHLMCSYEVAVTETSFSLLQFQHQFQQFQHQFQQFHTDQLLTKFTEYYHQPSSSLQISTGLI